MAEPPVSVGAAHVTVSLPPPETSVAAAGAPGSPTGVALAEESDQSLSPGELVARTCTT